MRRGIALTVLVGQVFGDDVRQEHCDVTFDGGVPVFVEDDARCGVRAVDEANAFVYTFSGNGLLDALCNVDQVNFAACLYFDLYEHNTSKTVCR